MIKEILQLIVRDKKRQGLSRALIINYLKEYFQYLVLSLIYNNLNFNKLIFKGGSCLRVCYQLPRLSEDLDFDFNPERFSVDLLPDLSRYLKKEIELKYSQPVETKIQSTLRIYLKFPILKNLGLTPKGESDKLYVKVEINNKTLPAAGFNLTPISHHGYNFIGYHYDLPTLMVGKINAFLYRTWFKGKNSQVKIKGRDFYDLYWFLNRGVQPNWSALRETTKIRNKKQLRKEVLARIEKTNLSQLAYDLRNFINDQVFVSQFAKNYRKIISSLL